MSSAKKILFQLSGSIACYKAADLVSKLVQRGHEVQTVASKKSLRFIGEATLEGLTGRPVLTELFAQGHLMDHITLARWADLSILCPATANTINRLAAGLADDLIGALYLARPISKPMLLAPAMNTHMLEHPSVQTSLGKLRAANVTVLPSDVGSLACGEVGAGRLLNTDSLLLHIDQALATCTTEPSNTSCKNILITSGGTTEMIDGVRSLTNFSSGATGARMAEYFYQQGHHVTLLHADNAELPKSPVKKIPFSDFQDLKSKLLETVKTESFDLAVQLAAISDYSLDHIEVDGIISQPQQQHKLSSQAEKLSVHFKRNPKLVNLIKQTSSNPDLKLAAFKLTHNASEKQINESVHRVFTDSQADIVVHNELSEVSKEDSGKSHNFNLYHPSTASQPINCQGKTAMFEHLGELLGELL